MTTKTAKQEIHERVEAMTQEEAELLLDFLNLQSDPDTLTDEEYAAAMEGKAEIERGEYIEGEELERKYGFRD